MKYVIFEQEKTGLKMPVIFPDHVTHNAITIEGAQPVSAGFCFIDPEMILSISSESSDSLSLRPLPEDRELIIAMLMDMGMYAFLRF